MEGQREETAEALHRVGGGDCESTAVPICPLSDFVFLAVTGCRHAAMIKARPLGSSRIVFLSGGWKGTEREVR